MKAVALLLALFAFAAPIRSQVHTVGPPGSGADFTTIQAAVDAASPGDTVLVSAGSFPGFSLSKPLLVVGAGSGATTLTSIYPFGTAVSVSGVPAGEVAAVSGMAFQPAAFAFLGTGLEVNQNDGTVVLHDLASLNDDFGQLEVNVTERLVGSRLDLTSDGLPGATLRAYTSSVWFVDSGFKKAIMGPFGWSTPVSTARFVDVEGSLAGCALLGTDSEPTWVANGGDALDLSASQLVAARSTCLGGQGSMSGEGGFGARLAGGATLLADASTVLQGGLDGAGVAQQAPALIEPGSTLAQSPAALPTLSISAATAQAGEVLGLDLYGEPGAAGVLFVSLAPGAGASFPGLEGDVFVDVAAPILLGAILLDGTGETHLNLTVPALPEPMLPTFQWAALSSGVVLSNPAFVAVR